MQNNTSSAESPFRTYVYLMLYLMLHPFALSTQTLCQRKRDLLRLLTLTSVP